MIRIYIYGQEVPRYILKPKNCVVRFAGLITVVYRRKGKTYVAPVVAIHAFEVSEEVSDDWGFMPEDDCYLKTRFMLPGRWM